MLIEIKGKEYELKWNLEAINYLDNIYTIDFDVSGMKAKFGAGLQSGIAQLSFKSPVVVAQFIRAGLKHYKAVIFSDEAIENVIIERINKDGDLDLLIEDIKKSLKDNPLTRGAVSDLDEEVEAEEMKAHTKMKKK